MSGVCGLEYSRSMKTFGMLTGYLKVNLQLLVGFKERRRACRVGRPTRLSILRNGCVALSNLRVKAPISMFYR